MSKTTGTTIKNDGNDVSITSTAAVNERDLRYRDIVQQQLGKNGVALFAVFGFITVLIILAVMFVSVGYSATSVYGNKLGGSSGVLDRSALTSITTAV